MNPPWPPEVACDLARMHIEDGDFSGMFVMGTAESNGIVPCWEPPRMTAAMLGLKVMAGDLPRPDWLIFLADTYHVDIEDESERPLTSLEEAFRAGDPRVKEAAVVLCVCPDGPSYEAFQTYVRDGSAIEWGQIEVKQNVSDLVGVIYDLMYAVLQTEHGSMPGAADGIEEYRVAMDDLEENDHED